MNTIDSSAEPQELRDLAVRQIQSNQPEEAQATLESLIRKVPEDVPACLELANLMFGRGQFRASSAPLLQAVEHLPKNAPLVLHTAQHLIGRGEIVAARRCLDFLSSAPNPPPRMLVSMARLYFAMGDIAQAGATIERALDAGADEPDDHHMHAMLLQFSGDIDGACRVLEAALERWPDFGALIVTLVNLRKQKPEDNKLAVIDERLQQLPDAGRDQQKALVRAEFEYARFKTLDDLDRAEDAWPALSRCNSIMHRLNPYDRGDQDQVLDALLGADGLFGSSSGASALSDGPIPIFIVGMPRSGTTLLDRMLSSHSKVASAGELMEFWRQLHWVADERLDRNHSLRRIIARHDTVDFREVGERYVQQTQWLAQGRKYYIDKLPANIRMVAFIRRALPHAKILHMVRDPMDVCFSNYKAMFGQGTSAYSYDLEALAHYFRGYKRLCSHWHQQEPGCMLDVSYASLVEDTEATMLEVLGYCGLDAEDACMHPERNTAPVATPSSAQVREPIHRRNIGQWRRYAEPLQPLQEAIADLL